MTQPDRIPLPEPMWFVAFVHPQREFDAAIALRRAGYYTWLPYVVIKRTYKRPNLTIRKIVEVKKPHYDRYVFVALRYRGESLAGLHDIAIVSSVVKTPMTGIPLCIPNAVMDRIMALGDGTEFIREIDEVSAKSRMKYAKGEEVALKDTPFDEFTAIVEEDLGEKVVWVEVAGKHRVAVKPEQIEGTKVAA